MTKRAVGFVMALIVSLAAFAEAVLNQLQTPGGVAQATHQARAREAAEH